MNTDEMFDRLGIALFGAIVAGVWIMLGYLILGLLGIMPL